MDRMAEIERQLHEGQREMFVEHVRALVGYWSLPHEDKQFTLDQRLHHLAFSILSLLDGASPEVGPRYIVKPRGTDDDPDDIGGQLAETYWPTPTATTVPDAPAI